MGRISVSITLAATSRNSQAGVSVKIEYFIDDRKFITGGGRNARRESGQEENTKPQHRTNKEGNLMSLGTRRRPPRLRQIYTIDSER